MTLESPGFLREIAVLTHTAIPGGGDFNKVFTMNDARCDRVPLLASARLALV